MIEIPPQAIATADQAAAAADQALSLMIKNYQVTRDAHGDVLADFVTRARLGGEPWTQRRLAVALVAALRRLAAER